MKTHYDVLGVPPDADLATIKAAYRRALKENHPDFHEGDDIAEAAAKEIIDAYALLRDAARRFDCDERLRARKRQRRRLFLITLLVSTGMASLASLGLVYLSLAPDGQVMARASEAAPAAEAAPFAIVRSGPAIPDAAPARSPEPAPAAPPPGSPPDAAPIVSAAPSPVPPGPADAARVEAIAEVPDVPPALSTGPFSDADTSGEAPLFEPVGLPAPEPRPHPADPEADPVIVALSETLRLAPGSAERRLERAAAWAARGAPERALKDYSTLLAQDENNIAAYHARGLLWQRLGDDELALADLDRAIRLSFSDARIYLDRGVIWFEKGRFDRAIADFDRAIKLAPDFASAYYRRGLAYAGKGDAANAEANFTEAARLDPTLTKPLFKATGGSPASAR